MLEEAWVSGTHSGTYHGLPPTGRRVEVQVLGIYVFEEDRLVCERVYYDLLTVLVGLGVARDPDSPLGQVMTLRQPPGPPRRARSAVICCAAGARNRSWMSHRSRSRSATTGRTR